MLQVNAEALAQLEGHGEPCPSPSTDAHANSASRVALESYREYLIRNRILQDSGVPRNIGWRFSDDITPTPSQEFQQVFSTNTGKNIGNLREDTTVPGERVADLSIHPALRGPSTGLNEATSRAVLNSPVSPHRHSTLTIEALMTLQEVLSQEAEQRTPVGIVTPLVESTGNSIQGQGQKRKKKGRVYKWLKNVLAHGGRKMITGHR